MKSLMTLMTICLFLSCSESKNNQPSTGSSEFLMFVASETRKGTLVHEYECYIVKFAEDDPWQIIPDRISGFEYVPGFEYELIVERVQMNNPPEDFLAWYRLKKVVSAIKKQSTNLPQ